ncbi:MAG: hypothetical protein LBL66_04455 [Clostridiales bacterium]|jgi:hypothetical protein|nr:hypothetical protein [Clostridiales bacterium]
MREEGAGRFLCLVEIAASRFALLAMTKGAFALFAMTSIAILHGIQNDRKARLE